MDNGFIVEIDNASNQTITICLFIATELPNTVKVKAYKHDLNYQALFKIAKTKGFIGSGIKSEFPTTVTVYRGSSEPAEIINITPYQIQGINIVLDGYLHYIEISVPPNTDNGLLQLVPKY